MRAFKTGRHENTIFWRELTWAWSCVKFLWESSVKQICWKDIHSTFKNNILPWHSKGTHFSLVVKKVMVMWGRKNKDLRFQSKWSFYKIYINMINWYIWGLWPVSSCRRFAILSIYVVTTIYLTYKQRKALKSEAINFVASRRKHKNTYFYVSILNCNLSLLMDC